ncbi:MAG TPA: hypothetical protein VFN21_01350, partial [Acidimicrobiales bacterium]|nr:hypothetical protein [Acidimicrobiales bacterium]
MHRSDDRIVFAAYGVDIDVEVTHECSEKCAYPSLFSGVDGMLPPGAAARTTARDAPHAIRVTCRGTTLAVTCSEEVTQSFGDLALALHAVDQAIRSTIAVHAPGLVFIHAGAVAVDGQVIVLPGTSMAGKTTLVAELVRAGAGYLSDEYAVLDADGLVHPFARRLSVREPTGRREVPVAELGGTTVTGPLPVGLVAAITFESGADWQVGPGDQGSCARAL